MTQKTYTSIGTRRKLNEGGERVTGRARYTGDVKLPGMLHARPVLSPYAHATITSIDIRAAQAMPGVVAVLRAEDLPTKDRAINSRHSAVLARGRVLFRGQPVVLVVAESEAQAEDAAGAVLIEYDLLPVVMDSLAAQEPGALVIWPEGLPKEGMDLTAAHAAVEKGVEEQAREPSNVHAENHFARGDAARGLAEADVVIERTYRTPIVHQAYLEPNVAVAEPDVMRRQMTVYVSTQGQFGLRDEIARLLGLPQRNVRVVPMTVGGGFGAKYGIIEALTAAAAWVVEQPVRLVLTRSEDFLTTTPTPATIIELKLGAKRDGTLTALHGKVTLDNGVFPFAIGGIVGILLGGYYKCANVHIDCYEVFTNKPQGGAYRAPGAPAATFALESSVDDLARELGIDALEFRRKNAAETGDAMGNGDPWPSMGLRNVLDALAAHPAWTEQSARSSTQNSKLKAQNLREGVGIAVGGWPCGVGPAAAVCGVEPDGTVRVQVGSVDISGVNTTYALVAAEILGVSPDDVVIVQADTEGGLFAPPSGGSQTTYSVSGAVANAAREVRRKLLDMAADEYEASANDLEIIGGQVKVKGVPDRAISLGHLAQVAQRKLGGPGPLIGEGRAAAEQNAPGFVVHLARVAVDTDTGEVTLKQYVAVQDVGTALNPLLVEGQIHGGVAQGIGMALSEALVYDDDGQLLTATFMDYSIPTAEKLPEIEAVIVENPSPFGPFGARGIGEPPIIPGGAAIANAIRAAVGVRVTELPVRSEMLWRAMQGVRREA